MWTLVSLDVFPNEGFSSPASSTCPIWHAALWRHHLHPWQRETELLIPIMWPPTEPGLEQGVLRSSVPREGTKAWCKNISLKRLNLAGWGPHIELDVSKSLTQEYSPLSLQLRHPSSHHCAQCCVYTDRSPYFSRPCDLLCLCTDPNTLGPGFRR